MIIRDLIEKLEELEELQKTSVIDIQTREFNSIRVIREGSVHTQDYRLDRLNIYLTTNGVLSSIGIG